MVEKQVYELRISNICMLSVSHYEASQKITPGYICKYASVMIRTINSTGNFLLGEFNLSLQM